jgi:beta-glucanase (GH16 family)
VSRRAQSYPGISITGKSFRRGYFEARIRIPSGVGHHSAWWMLSENWIRTNGDCAEIKNAELDILETYGNQPSTHYHALHRNTSSQCEMPDETAPTWPDVSRDVGFDMSQDFHVFAARWTASEVVWYVDGRELERAPVWDTTDQPMTLILSSFVGYFGPEPDETTPDELDVQVDWVRVWQEPLAKR